MSSEGQPGGEAGGPPPNPPTPPTPPPLPPPGRSAGEGSFTGRAREDLRVVLPHLTAPLEQLKTFSWADNRKAIAIAAVGLMPLLIYTAYGKPGDIANAFWAIALYFSTLWALFFYFVFPTPEARFSTAAICFFGTTLLSIGVLLPVYSVWPLKGVFGLIGSGDLVVRWLGFVFGVGLPEELCKALIVIYVAKRFAPLRPQSMLFYGLMAGLGFGIYEGVEYQWRRNPFISRGLGEYYLLNMLRLTTLPFLHAIWTGIAGYFIGFAAQYPERKRGLLIVAIGLPSLLHGTYNTFSYGGGVIALLVALVSVLALNLYLARSVDFEKLLAGRPRE